MLAILPLDVLREHEEINACRLKEIVEEIKAKNAIVPIVVDRKSRVILDGHHRMHAMKMLGYKMIPAILVDYNSSDVKVFARRKNIKVSKEAVVMHAMARKKFPPKTTRHVIKNKPQNIIIPLSDLR